MRGAFTMNNEKEFLLELENIREAIEFVTDSLKKLNITSREITQAQLFVEESMVYWINKASIGSKVWISFRKRFKTISLIMSYEGPAANPMAISGLDDLSELDLIGSKILVGLSQATYEYKNGTNKINFTIKQKQINPTVAIGGALLSAVLLGLLVNNFFYEFGTIITNTLLNPIGNTFFGLLNGLVAPLLFVSVLSSMFNMENLSQIKVIFRSLFTWYLGFTFLAALIGVVTAVFYFPLTNKLGKVNGGEGVWSPISEMIFGSIPTNLIRPFLDGNTLQIIFLAIFIGMVMLTMKGRFPIIINLVTEINLILLDLLDAVVSIMPLIVFISIFNLVTSGNTELLLNSWAPIILIILCLLIFFLFLLLSVFIIERISPLEYMRTMGPTLLISILTASSSATFSKHDITARVKQNIRDHLVKFAIPIGSLFSRACLVPFLIVMSLFIGEYYGVTFSTVDLYVLAILCIILSLSFPPAPGMGSFLFTVIFKKFGIPMESLAMVLTIFILFDYIMTTLSIMTSNVCMLHVEKSLRKKDAIINTYSV